MSTAVLIYIGTGIVAQPNTKEDSTIGVYPQELLADANGNVTDVTDINGLTQADIITASHRNTDAYAIGTPLLVEGDVVTLLEHADTGVVYWEPFKRSLIRKVTKLGWAYPAKKDDDVDDTADNNYMVNFDTEEGTLSLATTKDQGEAVRYRIELNTKGGIFTFQVDNTDFLQWDNKSRKFTLITEDINIQAKTVYIKGETTIDGNVTITKNLTIKKSASSGGNVNVKGSVKAGKMMRSKLGRFPNLD